MTKQMPDESPMIGLVNPSGVDTLNKTFAGGLFGVGTTRLSSVVRKSKSDTRNK